jgi:hypothetical protein
VVISTVSITEEWMLHQAHCSTTQGGALSSKKVTRPSQSQLCGLVC